MATNDLGSPELRWVIVTLVASGVTLLLAFAASKAAAVFRFVSALTGLSPLVYLLVALSEEVEVGDVLSSLEPGAWGTIAGLVAASAGGSIDLAQKAREGSQ